MIKQLERRFTIVAISVVSLVLLMLVLFVQLISLELNIYKADAILDNMAENGAEEFYGIEANRGNVDVRSVGTFSVTIPFDGDLENEYHQIGGVEFYSEEFALEYADYALEDYEESKGRKNRGFAEEFRYLVVENDDSWTIYFLDYTFEQQSNLTLLRVSLAAFVGSVILITILVRLLMRFVMKPIKDSYTKQKQFITDASHELKTPLTVILTHLQIMEMEQGETKSVRSVKKQVDRLTTLSNDLVELSRMDETDTKLTMKGLNFSSLVDNVVFGIEPALKASGKELVLSIEEDIKLDGNYDSLDKLLNILMENSLKYCSENGTVNVELFKKGKSVTLIVENTVDEIEEGLHNEFFERFYRADKSRNSRTGGFGIGLAVAQSIVEQHKGKITAESKDGKSITFKIQL